MITAVIPVSPIPSHPDTSIIEETVASIRHHLPDTELLLTFDGVRPEQEDRRDAYEQAIYRTLWLADHKWRNTCPFIYDDHLHQVGMIRETIDQIRTPLLMYVEQDTPLVTDEPIDWQTIIKFITSGHSNCVRLHHEAVIPTDHEHMMHGVEDGFIRTSQWSQRPHIASVAYYRRALTNFTPNARCFIEDKMHGIVDNAYLMDGMLGWDQHKLHIYDPGNGNLKRSYHLDGRAGEPKYDAGQVF